MTILLSSFAMAVFSVVVQGPSGSDIARQMDSTDATIVAWGAYNAGAYHRDDMIPRLRQLLETPPAIAPQERVAFLDVVMDAMIQLNARMPATLVLPHMQEHPVQTFVLLANATERQDVLLRVLPQLSGNQWFAAADMLFEDRAPGLIAELVRPLRLRVTMYVVDRDYQGAWGEAGAAGIAIGDGIGQNPRGFPPHAEYRFESAARGFVVLAPGPHPVYYSRTVTRAFQYPVSTVIVQGPGDDDRLGYLHAMSDAGAAQMRAETSDTVRWTTASALISRARELRAQATQHLRYLVDRAGRVRPLPANLVINPPVDVRLVDKRSDKTIPLPTIDQ